MQLRELVERYREQAGPSEEPVALKDFGLPRVELVGDLAAFDEDYQISRFLQFTRAPEATGDDVYNIGGAACTHLKILPGIDALL
jgi:hypothetical protein